MNYRGIFSSDRFIKYMNRDSSTTIPRTIKAPRCRVKSKYNLPGQGNCQMTPIYRLQALYFPDPAYASCNLMCQQFLYTARFPVYSGQILVQSTNKCTSLLYFLNTAGKYLKSQFIMKLNWEIGWKKFVFQSGWRTCNGNAVAMKCKEMHKKWQNFKWIN